MKYGRSLWKPHEIIKCFRLYHSSNQSLLKGFKQGDQSHTLELSLIYRVGNEGKKTNKDSHLVLLYMWALKVVSKFLKVSSNYFLKCIFKWWNIVTLNILLECNALTHANTVLFLNQNETDFSKKCFYTHWTLHHSLQPTVRGPNFISLSTHKLTHWSAFVIENKEKAFVVTSIGDVTYRS